MVSKVKKRVGGVVIVFVVLALIGACLGEDEGDSEYLAWLEKKCPNCIFEKVERFEGRALDRNDDEIRLACGMIGYSVSKKCEEIVVSGLASQKSEFDDTIKVTQIVRTYKVKDEYKPESEWSYRQFTEFVYSVLSMPKGIERMRITQDKWAVSISDKGVWENVIYSSRARIIQKYNERNFSFDLSNKEKTARIVDEVRARRTDFVDERIALIFLELSWREPVYIYFAKK